MAAAEQYKFNNLVWNGWKALSEPLEVIVSDMTAFKVKGTYYELTLYFDAWSKEIIGYGLSNRKSAGEYRKSCVNRKTFQYDKIEKKEGFFE